MWCKFQEPTSLLACCLAICLLFSATNGQKFNYGSCPTVTGATVSILGLTGTWFEYERTPTLQEHNIRCPTYTFTYDLPNTRWILVVGGTNKLTGNPINTNGYASHPNGATTGTLYVRFPSLFLSRFPMTYYVIATDGTAAVQGTYMVLYSCSNFGLRKLENVIVLTSAKFPTQATIDIAEGFAAGRVAVRSLRKSDQTNC